MQNLSKKNYLNQGQYFVFSKKGKNAFNKRTMQKKRTTDTKPQTRHQHQILPELDIPSNKKS